MQQGSPAKELLLKTGDGALFIKKVAGTPGPASVAVLMGSWAACRDIKWNRIPETSFNQQISKVRITLSSRSLAKVNSGPSMQN